MSGLTHVDHFQPGCKVARPKVTSLTVTTSTLPLSNERVSSGRARLFFCIFSVVVIIISSITVSYHRNQSLSKGRRAERGDQAVRSLCSLRGIAAVNGTLNALADEGRARSEEHTS